MLRETIWNILVDYGVNFFLDMAYIKSLKYCGFNFLVHNS